MSPSIDELDDDAYARLLAPVWDFLALTHDPAPSDVIFVFGSRDLAVAGRAAELYNDGLADRVLVSGRLGRMTEGVFDRPEALVFKDELTRRGVPDRAVTTEVAAGNTLENVRFGMAALAATGKTPRSTLLVAKTFVMRRCLATFARHHPSVAARGCPPARGRPSPPGSSVKCAGSTSTGRVVTSSSRWSQRASARRRVASRWCCRLGDTSPLPDAS